MIRVIDLPNSIESFQSAINRTLAGEAFFLSKDGQVIAHVVPVRQKTKRTLGFLEGKVDESFFDPLPQSELGSWE